MSLARAAAAGSPAPPDGPREPQARATRKGGERDAAGRGWVVAVQGEEHDTGVQGGAHEEQHPRQDAESEIDASVETVEAVELAFDLPGSQGLQSVHAQ